MAKKYHVVPKTHLQSVESKEGQVLVRMLIQYRKQQNKSKAHLQGFREAIWNYQDEHNIELAAPLSVHFENYTPTNKPKK